MPRPGPRPYECVRRAWHSDRHQPMRGSIIQQIFRLVQERHSVATKKNREWQQKLPIVVLKAEEIIYSKANSEAEYMDPDTLWDRANDAIDTIIRRDETAETGQFLPPCVEAALNLGCIPERASRSQRNSNPRSYLSPRTQEPHAVHPKVFNTNDQNSPSSSLPNQPAFLRPSSVISPPRLASEFDRPVMSGINNLGASSSSKNVITPERNRSCNVGSVYPLYYGSDFQPKVPPVCFRKPLDNIIIGKPIYPSYTEPAEVNRFSSFFPCGRDDVKDKLCQADYRDMTRSVPELDCDLSLRLGRSADSVLHLESGRTSSIGDIRPSDDFHERDQFKLMPASQVKEFTFFPAEPANSPPGLHGTHGHLDGYGHNAGTMFKKRKMHVRPDVGFQERHDLGTVSANTTKELPFFLAETANSPSRQQTGWENLGREGQNPETLLRRHKMPFHNNLELGQFLWHDEQTLNHFPGQIDGPGL